MRTRMFAVTAVVVTLVVMPLLAAVSWDPATGVGTVGKGDVQLALNYNNSQMQKSAGNLIFKYTNEATYGLTCVKEWETGPARRRTLHTIMHPLTQTTTIAATVAYEARTRNQVNGFRLNGWAGAPVVSGAVPACSGGFRPFDRAVDWDINNDGFVVDCPTDGSACTFTDASGMSGNGTGPFAIYSAPTLLGSSGGLLTVQDTANGLPSLVWPIPVVVVP